MGTRIRTIKPEIVEDGATAELSDSAWRLFVGCITQANDYGCLKADTFYLRLTMFAGRRDVDIDALLEELEQAGRRPGRRRGLVWTYSDGDGHRFLKITNWEKHQRVDNAGKLGRLDPPLPPEDEPEEPESAAETPDSFRRSSAEDLPRGGSPRVAANRGEQREGPETRRESPRVAAGRRGPEPNGAAGAELAADRGSGPPDLGTSGPLDPGPLDQKEEEKRAHVPARRGAALAFPCRDGGTWEPGDAELGAWIAAFRGLDLEQELRSLVAYVGAKKSRRKLRAEYPAWLVNCLGSSKKMAGASSAAPEARGARGSTAAAGRVTPSAKQSREWAEAHEAERQRAVSADESAAAAEIAELRRRLTLGGSGAGGGARASPAPRTKVNGIPA